MTYVVTENCINCKHTTCVECCPAEAFREGPNFLVIDPQACVDCDLCVHECPVDAIYADYKVPADQQAFIELNQRLSKVWPIIDTEVQPMADHQRWDGVEGKLALLALVEKPN